MDWAATSPLIPLTKNEALINAFCEQFSPPLKPVRTLRVNGVAYPDAWQANHWDAGKCLGITAVAYEGQLHAFLEASGRADTAQRAGRAMAQALGMVGETV